MEIKIIKTEKDKNPITFLYEGENINHSLYNFSTKNEFQEKYNELTNNLTNNLNGFVIGVPDEMWENKGDEICGVFAFIYFESGTENKFLAIMNSRVFVTCKGFTVDTFFV